LTALLAIAALSLLLPSSGVAGGRSTAAEPHVSGNRLVDQRNRPLQLRGVNFSGAEYICIDDDTVWDVPASDATIASMKAWKVNAVRLPLNEDCWLGINGMPWHSSPRAYRAAVAEFVGRLHAAGITVLLNLHLVAPGEEPAVSESTMADADHAPAFWRSVGAYFKDDPALLFDLYNEPKDISWDCWRDGCTDGYAIAGMQDLVDAVRSSGARQPVVADGLEYGNDVSGWLAHHPDDPARQLAAGFHNYGDLGCATRQCWQDTAGAIARQYPVIAGEIGEFDCKHAYVDQVMDWADTLNVSYLAWGWNRANCAYEPALLATLAGRPSPYGQGIHDHFLARAAAEAQAARRR
jgi:hypothetical protein